MQKQLGGAGLLALLIVGYLIWKDPTGTANAISGFFGAVGDFASTLWDKLGEFITSLVG
ncbi:MAG: hypothetical protein M9952_11575 [Microthrixaceae bacterium]|nr:hypothetical protein [Microthrixaceae bacterium]MCO5313559.1 hypothetical protein [Microthrixaceae bacterium]HPB46961.1 hypothetical protein [Microthrixaceae bacterium]